MAIVNLSVDDVIDDEEFEELISSRKQGVSSAPTTEKVAREVVVQAPVEEVARKVVTEVAQEKASKNKEDFCGCFSIPKSLKRMINLYIYNKEITFAKFIEEEVVDEINDNHFVYNNEIGNRIKELKKREKSSYVSAKIDIEKWSKCKRLAVLQYEVTLSSIILNKIAQVIKY